MQSIKRDTIGGFNAYLETLQKDENQYEFTFIKFDSNRFNKVYVGVPIEEVAPLSDETYKPGASTPLIDACVKTIKATSKAVKGREVNVVVVFQTDGEENASRKYTNSDLAHLIKKKTKKGWQFVYLGAGIDAFSHAKAMGIDVKRVASYGRKKSKAAFASIAANVSAYAAQGDEEALTFTQAQRNAMDDQHAHKYIKPDDSED